MLLIDATCCYRREIGEFLEKILIFAFKVLVIMIVNKHMFQLECVVCVCVCVCRGTIVTSSQELGRGKVS